MAVQHGDSLGATMRAQKSPQHSRRHKYSVQNTLECKPPVLLTSVCNKQSVTAYYTCIAHYTPAFLIRCTGTASFKEQHMAITSEKEKKRKDTHRWQTGPEW
ncbi:hypothetical protein I7I51_03649 [Histoplasma capsulatum]|uniref:Uncharacterized protein n=1 Tax=Ajellomyces capsulatus TaxID=5037 RepID=A0A8A1MA29_AJECA|nr:predicted protein [Histoplasma mississippiense (nom. inval.)]EDN07084.1 predicted protein [Histoplasma mississippiense (nom. inval.)]QSS61474.1 hypothetical protein I7I51_03649 [Histoplasma capsulatum]